MLFHKPRLNEMGPGVSLPAVHPVCLLPGWCCAGGSRQSCVAYEAGSPCSSQAATVQLRTCADLYYYFDPHAGLPLCMTQLPVTVAATSVKAEMDRCLRVVISSAAQLQSVCVWGSTS